MNQLGVAYTSGVFPDLWKHAVFTPIQKTNFITELTNFRPISALPVLSKVLEQVHSLWSIDFIIYYKARLSVRISSELDVLLHITDSWKRVIDDSKFTAVAFLDISKAFDSVNYDNYITIKTGMLWCISYLVCELLIMSSATSLFTRVIISLG